MPPTSPHSDAARAPDGSPARSSPRAFAAGTGLVFQVVGAIYVLGGCCLWSLAGQIIDRPVVVRSWWSGESGAPDGDGAPTGQVARTTDRASHKSIWAQRGGAAAVIGTFLGGLALVAFGIGIQGEKYGSAFWGAISAGALVLLWLVCASIWGLAAGAWLRAGLALLLAGLNAMLMLLAAYSARTLRLFPPPPDESVVSGEFVRQFEHRLPPEEGAGHDRK